ncbi:MAG: glycine cleavage system protein GcvH [Myxococcota bacterium]
MANIETDRVYSKEHEWVLVDPDDDGVAVVGVSDYAQEKMGDIVMVELPDAGDTFEQDEPLGTVESPKSVSDVFAPVSGEVVAVNEELEDSPEQVNESPYVEGWLVKIRMDDASELDDLMNPEAYQSYLDGLDE